MRCRPETAAASEHTNISGGGEQQDGCHEEAHARRGRLGQGGWRVWMASVRMAAAPPMPTSSAARSSRPMFLRRPASQAVVIM